MATLLDTSLIAFLFPLFIFLLIFVAIYALLSKTNLFGEKQTTLNLLAAICIAAVAVFAGNLVTALGSIIPWIVFMIIILVLVFGLYKMFGVEEKEVWASIGGHTVIYIIILFVVLIGLITAFRSDVSPFTEERAGAPVATSEGETQSVQGQTVQGEVIKTITHPRLLGALFILIVSALTVKLLVDKVEKS